MGLSLFFILPGSGRGGCFRPVEAARGLGKPGRAPLEGLRDQGMWLGIGGPGGQPSRHPCLLSADVHPQQHASHTAQLPRCPGHVLQAPRLRGPAERQQPHDGRGLLAPCKLQPLLGLVPAQPPGRLDPPVVPNGPQPSPPPPPTAHVAPRGTARRLPAESHGCRGWPEMRLDAAGR